jgi:hypothetical protein
VVDGWLLNDMILEEWLAMSAVRLDVANLEKV